MPEQIHSLPTKPNDPTSRDTSDWRASFKPAMEASSGKGSADTAFHTRNFLDCLKSRKQTNCDTLEGHRSNVGPLIGNIAHKVKSTLVFDEKLEHFSNHPAANEYLHYEYRKGFSIDL